MSKRIGRSTFWILVAAGVAGLVLSVATLPSVWALLSGQAQFGFFVGPPIPRWAWWRTISSTGAPLIVGALLCGLILATGRIASRLVALGGLVWLVWATMSFATDSNWMKWMALRGDATPLSYQISGFGIVLGMLSITAILIARKTSRAQSGASAGSGQQGVEPKASTVD